MDERVLVGTSVTSAIEHVHVRLIGGRHVAQSVDYCGRVVMTKR